LNFVIFTYFTGVSAWCQLSTKCDVIHRIFNRQNI